MNCDCGTTSTEEYIRANKNPDTGLTVLQKWVGCKRCGLPINSVETNVIATSRKELRQRPAPIKKIEKSVVPNGGKDHPNWRAQLVKAKK